MQTNTNLRFTDLTRENGQILNPIIGLDKQLIISFTEVIKSLGTC
jgi:hypothetical protein